MTQPDTQASPADAPKDDAPPADKTFTQAEVNAIVAREKRTAKPADYDDLRKKAADFDKIQESQQTEQERATKAQQAAATRADQAEARALRFEVAFEKGLTPAQAKRLVGSSREELEADAEEILTDFPVKTDGRPKGDIDQGPRPPAPPSDPRAADRAQIEADITAGKRR